MYKVQSVVGRIGRWTDMCKIYFVHEACIVQSVVGRRTDPIWPVKPAAAESTRAKIGASFSLFKANIKYDDDNVQERGEETLMLKWYFHFHFLEQGDLVGVKTSWTKMGFSLFSRREKLSKLEKEVGVNVVIFNKITQDFCCWSFDTLCFKHYKKLQSGLRKAKIQITDIYDMLSRVHSQNTSA